ncbi:hypothetical protein FRX31_033270, partial [Thalictrum thalictroides]
MMRTSFARVCVEVDTDFDYPDHVNAILDDTRVIKIPMEYSWKPPRCSGCKVFGHSDVKCPKKKQVVKKVTKDHVWLKKQEEVVIEEDNDSTEKVLEENGDGNDEAAKDDEGWETPGKKHTCKTQQIEACVTTGIVITEGSITDEQYQEQQDKMQSETSEKAREKGKDVAVSSAAGGSAIASYEKEGAKKGASPKANVVHTKTGYGGSKIPPPLGTTKGS